MGTVGRLPSLLCVDSYANASLTDNSEYTPSAAQPCEYVL